MTSTLGYALLGLLAREPLTGYELSRLMRSPISFFWHAGHSQIYPELARLAGDSLVRYQVVAGPGPRENKRYEITDAGRASVQAWLAEPGPPALPRDQFLLRVWSIWMLEPDQAVRLVERRRDEHAEQLAEYEETAAKLRVDVGAELDDPSAPLFASYALVERGIAFERMAMEWCGWLLERLRGASSD